MRTLFTVVVFVSFCLLVQASDLFVGTWKLNVAKSKLLDTDTVSQTMTIKSTGPNTFLTTLDRLTKYGQTRHQEINRTRDGKEHPATGAGFKQEGATEIVEQVDASTLKVTQNRDGKVISEFTSTISPDGKTMTNIRHNPDGAESVLIFERQ